MTELEASLIIRMELALCAEGIGARDPAPEDREVLEEAVIVAGHLFNECHDLHDAGLISGTLHFARCTAPWHRTSQ